MENNTEKDPEKENGISDEAERAARRERVFGFLRAHDIDYEVYYHPEAPTIEIARRYWRRDGSKHCKNLFFRNHKATATISWCSTASASWPYTIWSTACIRANCRLPRSSAWTGILVCVRGRSRHSDL